MLTLRPRDPQETLFPPLMPKAGKAVFWPATLDAEPFTSDDRTHHEALPVTKGVKYAANFWIHQYDYISAHKSGCTS